MDAEVELIQRGDLADGDGDVVAGDIPALNGVGAVAVVGHRHGLTGLGVLGGDGVLIVGVLRDGEGEVLTDGSAAGDLAHQIVGVAGEGDLRGLLGAGHGDHRVAQDLVAGDGVLRAGLVDGAGDLLAADGDLHGVGIAGLLIQGEGVIVLVVIHPIRQGHVIGAAAGLGDVVAVVGDIQLDVAGDVLGGNDEGVRIRVPRSVVVFAADLIVDVQALDHIAFLHVDDEALAGLGGGLIPQLLLRAGDLVGRRADGDVQVALGGGQRSVLHVGVVLQVHAGLGQLEVGDTHGVAVKDRHEIGGVGVAAGHIVAVAADGHNAVGLVVVDLAGLQAVLLHIKEGHVPGIVLDLDGGGVPGGDGRLAAGDVDGQGQGLAHLTPGVPRGQLGGVAGGSGLFLDGQGQGAVVLALGQHCVLSVVLPRIHAGDFQLIRAGGGVGGDFHRVGDELTHAFILGIRAGPSHLAVGEVVVRGGQGCVGVVVLDFGDGPALGHLQLHLIVGDGHGGRGGHRHPDGLGGGALLQLRGAQRGVDLDLVCGQCVDAQGAEHDQRQEHGQGSLCDVLHVLFPF